MNDAFKNLQEKTFLLEIITCIEMVIQNGLLQKKITSFFESVERGQSINLDKQKKKEYIRRS